MFDLGRGTENEFRARTNSFQIGDDISIVRATHHEYSFGKRSMVELAVRIPRTRWRRLRFQWFRSGSGLADFLTGRLFSFTQATNHSFQTEQKYFGAYGQDTWKMTPKLTFNYGVRWEPYFPQVIPKGEIYNFDYDRFSQGIKSTQYPLGASGSLLSR